MIDAKRAELQGRVMVSLVSATGGWKYRKGIPMPDEEIERAGTASVAELVYNTMRLAIAEKLLEERGLAEDYRKLCEEEKIPAHLLFNGVGETPVGVAGELGRSGEAGKT